MKVGSYGRLDPTKLKPLQEYSKNFLPSQDLHWAKASKHHWFEKEFWVTHNEIYQYLKENTFPYDAPIYDIWVKHYDSSYKVSANDGGFMGLHQDFIYDRPRDKDLQFIDKSIDKENMFITNSIILDVSDDLVGGETVLAGDSMTVGKVKDRFDDTRDLMHRLKVVHAKTVGDITVWNGYTVHGIAEITRGWRSSLMVLKRVPYDDKYFKV